VRFAFTEEQEELRRNARRMLEAHAGSPQLRRAVAGDSGHDDALWRKIAGELGWVSLIVPEQHGGSGLTQVELVGLLEEMGRALPCVPFFSTVCLGVNAILAAAGEAQQAALLPAIASGDRTATLAWREGDGTAIATVASAEDGGGWLLSGTKRHVVDGHTADLLIVAAREPGSRGADGLALFAVPADSEGIRRRRVTTMDMTRPLAEIVLDSVRVPDSARLTGGAAAGSAALQLALDLASVGLAAEQVGGAARCLELSVDYARTRTQFGRPIGSFQAIQHKCADMLVAVESARSAAYYAGWAAACEPSELAVAAPLAAATAAEAFYACAGETIQIHGGVGFTWEHDAHFFFKRARAGTALLATPVQQRERIARSIGLGGGRI
jgi:alkylation response protein AidB-like acyl-CoA dehydrogenase